MKKVTLILIFFLTSSIGRAVNSAKKEGSLIETSFIYKNQDTVVNTSKTQIFEKNMQTWTPLTDCAKDVTLLGKFIENSNHIIKWEFIVLDNSGATPFVISNISVIAKEGQSAKVSIQTDTGASMDITIKSSPTAYWNYSDASFEDVLSSIQR